MPERSEIIIRKYQELDRLNVVSLIEENGLTKGRPAGYLHGILDRRSILVADKTGDVVGTVVIDGPKNNSCRINYVAVHQSLQRLGVGKILMTHAEKFLRSIGARKVGLMAYEKNPRLINFYQNFGFVLVNADGEMRRDL